MRLAIFDFDGTLFRSPEAPTWFDKGWWVSQESLSEPCVPRVPGPQWWIGSTVKAAQQAISDPNTYAVMMTGRIDSVFRWRIPELLKKKGLNFDEVHLVKGGPSTPAYKLKMMARILSRYRFDLVEIWDDTASYLNLYQRILEKNGISVKTHYVKEKAMYPQCGPGDLEPEKKKKSVYEALVLLEKTKLLKWFLEETGQKLLPNVIANHVTIQLTQEPSPQVGKVGHVKVLGWFDNGRVQGVYVKPLDFTSNVQHPHITLSTQEGVPPKESNQALLGKVHAIQGGPTIRGVIGVSDGSRWSFKR